MTQITERPAERTTTGVTLPAQRLLAETERVIREIKSTDVEEGAALLGQLALLVTDPEADRPATAALFYRNNSGGRDTLGNLFYGGSGENDENGPIIAPSTSRVMNLGYRTALNSLHAALDSLFPAETSTLNEKRDFWEDVKTHLPSGQAMNDGQVSEVTSADLNTVLKAKYGRCNRRNLTAYTDAGDALNFVLFQPRTTEGTQLEIRSSLALNGEMPPIGAFSLRTLNGVVHFV